MLRGKIVKGKLGIEIFGNSRSQFNRPSGDVQKDKPFFRRNAILPGAQAQAQGNRLNASNLQKAKQIKPNNKTKHNLLLKLSNARRQTPQKVRSRLSPPRRRPQPPRRRLPKGKPLLTSQLLEITRDLIEGEDLEIRTKAFQSFSGVVSVSEKKFEKMLTDIIELGIDKGPDFVASHGIASLIELVRFNKPVATSILKTLSSTQGWRVRYAICHNIELIGDKFGRIVFKTFITKSLSDYLLDQNSETRIGALDALPKASKFMDAENICLHLVPCLSHLVNDSELAVSLGMTV